MEPIVYYLDSFNRVSRSAAPFSTAYGGQTPSKPGWDGAFEVRVLPEGADPLDVRYNVIQWVHRSTRGWSIRFVRAEIHARARS